MSVLAVALARIGAVSSIGAVESDEPVATEMSFSGDLRGSPTIAPIVPRRMVDTES